MTDEHYDELEDESELDATEEDFDLEDDPTESGEEFEEITSEEVDRVIETLEDLVESVESENIRIHLEETINNVFYLVYNDDDLEPEEDDLTAEAA